MPPGSILEAVVIDHLGTGSNTINRETLLAVGRGGLFRTIVYPKEGKNPSEEHGMQRSIPADFVATWLPPFYQHSGITAGHDRRPQTLLWNTRSILPASEGFQYLAKIGIKTVLDLREHDERSSAEEHTVTALGM